MCMALASIADDRDFSALDEIDVGIGIVIDAHGVILVDCTALRRFDWPTMRRRGGQKIPARGLTSD